MINAIIVNEIYKLFTYQESNTVFDLLNKASFPMVENGPLERIQFAILINSKSDIDYLKNEIKNAEADWRETLISAHLENENWKTVILKRGIELKHINETLYVNDLKSYEESINECLMTYLSGDKNQAAYDPINSQKRFKTKYKTEWAEKLKLAMIFINSIKIENKIIDSKNMNKTGEEINKMIRSTYPFLENNVRAQLVNMILYNNK